MLPLTAAGGAKTSVNFIQTISCTNNIQTLQSGCWPWLQPLEGHCAKSNLLCHLQRLAEGVASEVLRAWLGRRPCGGCAPGAGGHPHKGDHARGGAAAGHATGVRRQDRLQTAPGLAARARPRGRETCRKPPQVHHSLWHCCLVCLHRQIGHMRLCSTICGTSKEHL
jgi:hypothetical protein